jgi:hypothetical protein
MISPRAPDAPNVKTGETFVILLKRHGRVRFALWQNGVGAARDHLVLRSGTSQFLFADTEETLRKEAEALRLPLSEEPPCFYDMDRFRKTLARLRPLRLASTRTCRILLEGWNILEDMACTLHIPFDLPYTDASLLAVSEKLFYGNNLAAWNPEGEIYHPWIRSRERKAMRRHLRELWREICRRCPEIG